MLIKRIRGLFAWAVIGLLIGLGVAALAGKAHAATTTQVTINSTTFTDLGAAPVMVQSLNYPVQIVVSDSLPSPSTTNVGYALYNGQPVTIPAADSSSHVYAAMIGGNATTLVVTAVEAGGGGGGGSITGPLGSSQPDALSVAVTSGGTAAAGQAQQAGGTGLAGWLSTISYWLQQINTTAANPIVAVNVAPVTATNPAVVVDLRPDSPGIIPLGQAVKASSVPVTFASDQDPCSYAQKSSVKIAITTATTTAMVPVSGSTTVYVCGFDFTISNVITTANTLKFESGTGSACASPVADLTGIYNAGGITAAAPTHVQSAGTGGGTVFNGGASNGVCAVTAIGATGSFEGVLTYVQQ